MSSEEKEITGDLYGARRMSIFVETTAETRNEITRRVQQRYEDAVTIYKVGPLAEKIGYTMEIVAHKEVSGDLMAQLARHPGVKRAYASDKAIPRPV